MPVPDNNVHKFMSQTYSERISLIPASTAVIGGWTLAGVSFVTSLWVLPYFFPGGLLLLISTTMFTLFLLNLSSRFTYTSHLRFELIINATEVLVTCIDSQSEDECSQSMPLHRVTSAELFSANDIDSLTLFGPDQFLEIPLWAFATQAARIKQILQARGVTISIPKETNDDEFQWGQQAA